MKLLGIDYGLKKVGLAIGDDQSYLAQPYLVLKVSGSNQHSLVRRINDFCGKLEIDQIIVGMPGGKLAVKIKRFGKDLQQLTNLPVLYQDETLTSKEAVDKMIGAGVKRKLRREKEDAVSAALILEKYLENYV